MLKKNCDNLLITKLEPLHVTSRQKFKGKYIDHPVSHMWEYIYKPSIKVEFGYLCASFLFIPLDSQQFPNINQIVVTKAENFFWIWENLSHQRTSWKFHVMFTIFIILWVSCSTTSNTTTTTDVVCKDGRCIERRPINSRWWKAMWCDAMETSKDAWIHEEPIIFAN